MGGGSVAITTQIHIFKKYLNLVWLQIKSYLYIENNPK